jgi:hypothetical protein
VAANTLANRNPNAAGKKRLTRSEARAAINSEPDWLAMLFSIEPCLITASA